MLAGDPPYTGSTAQAIVAKVITEKAVPVTLHRDTVPANVAAAIQKAIAKLPADRFHTAAEFSEALANPSFTTAMATAALAVPGPPRGLSRLAWPAAALALAAFAAWSWLQPEAPQPVSRYGIAFPNEQRLKSGPYATFGLAPDGSWLVYVGPGPSEQQDQLWIKPRAQFVAAALAGTTGAWAPTPSPDGQWIAFLVGQQLRKIPIIGGASIPLADSVQTDNSSLVTWGENGVLTYVDRQWRLRRVAEAGGASAVAWTPPAGRASLLPTPLPKGRGVLFTLCDVNCRTVREAALGRQDAGVRVGHDVDSRCAARGPVHPRHPGRAGRCVFVPGPVVRPELGRRGGEPLGPNDRRGQGAGALAAVLHRGPL